MPASYDNLVWAEARIMYERGVALCDIQARLGPSMGQISRRAKRDGWLRPGKSTAALASPPTAAEIVESARAQLALAEDSAALLRHHRATTGRMRVVFDAFVSDVEAYTRLVHERLREMRADAGGEATKEEVAMLAQTLGVRASLIKDAATILAKVIPMERLSHNIGVPAPLKEGAQADDEGLTYEERLRRLAASADEDSGGRRPN